jgi:hypothetical protein
MFWRARRYERQQGELHNEGCSHNKCKAGMRLRLHVHPSAERRWGLLPAYVSQQEVGDRMPGSRLHSTCPSWGSSTSAVAHAAPVFGAVVAFPATRTSRPLPNLPHLQYRGRG